MVGLQQGLTRIGKWLNWRNAIGRIAPAGTRRAGFLIRGPSFGSGRDPHSSDIDQRPRPEVRARPCAGGASKDDGRARRVGTLRDVAGQRHAPRRTRCSGRSREDFEPMDWTEGKQQWFLAGPSCAESDMQKTRSIGKDTVQLVAAGGQLTGRRAMSANEGLATESPRPIIKPCWRDRAASVRFAGESPSVGSRSIIVIRPERCAAFFAATATPPLEGAMTIRTFCGRPLRIWKPRNAISTTRPPAVWSRPRRRNP